MINKNFYLMIKNSTYFLAIGIFCFLISCSSSDSSISETNENKDDKTQTLQPTVLVLPTNTPVVPKITKIPTAIPLPSPTATSTPVATATPLPTPIPSMPSPTPTALPLPTSTPFPTTTPLPTATMTPIPTPTPIILNNLERFVFNTNAEHFASNHDIYTMHLNSENITKLTDNYQDDINPKWSPNGQKIVFESKRDSTFWQLWSMNSDGTMQIPLTGQNEPTMSHVDASFSNDGNSIIYSNLDNNDLYLMDIDGSNKRRLTYTPIEEKSPKIINNDEYILFLGENRIYKMELNGIDTFDIVKDNNFQQNYQYFSVSNNEKYIAAISEEDSLWLIDIDGSNPKPISYFENLTESGTLHWSIDDKEILVTVNGSIWSVNFETRKKRQITFGNSQRKFEESDPLPVYNAQWGPVYVAPPPAPWVKYELEFSSYSERKKRVNTDKYNDLAGKFVIPNWLTQSSTGSSIDVGFRAFMPFSMTYIETKFQRTLDGAKVVEISRIHEPTGYTYWKYPINLKAETPDVYGITDFRLSVVGNQLLLITDGETHIIQGTPIDFTTEYFKDIEYFTNKDQLYLYPPSDEDKEESLIIDRVTLWDGKEVIIP